jgi:hypothetical protein
MIYPGCFPHRRSERCTLSNLSTHLPIVANTSTKLRLVFSRTDGAHEVARAESSRLFVSANTSDKSNSLPSIGGWVVGGGWEPPNPTLLLLILHPPGFLKVRPAFNFLLTTLFSVDAARHRWVESVQIIQS